MTDVRSDLSVSLKGYHETIIHDIEEEEEHKCKYTHAMGLRRIIKEASIGNDKRWSAHALSLMDKLVAAFIGDWTIRANRFKQSKVILKGDDYIQAARADDVFDFLIDFVGTDEIGSEDEANPGD